jgi:hypothetical protein
MEDNTADEVRLSDQTVVKIKFLNALESIQADEICGAESNETKTSKVYAIGSIREINGEKVYPLRNRLEFAELAGRIEFPELARLMKASGKQFQEAIPDDLKNELAA